MQWASVVVAHRYRSCGSWALEHRLSSCGAQALLLCGMWNLPRPGIKPMSPALAGRSLLPVPPCATKIMAYGPITSWQIDGETVETATDFIFGGSKITADGDCSHKIKSRLLLGGKVMTNLDSILKSRDIALPTKVCIVKAMVFPVVLYGCQS